MSGAQRDGDQSMDDILASIRKIISDDGAPGLAAEESPGEAGATSAGSSQSSDDLSDLLEDPRLAGAGARSEVSTGSSAVQSATNSEAAAWPAVDDGASGGPTSGSLTDKLASLGSGSGDANTAVASTTGVAAPGSSGQLNGPVQGSADLDPEIKSESQSLEATLASVREAAAAAVAPTEPAQIDAVAADASAADVTAQVAEVTAPVAPDDGVAVGIAAIDGGSDNVDVGAAASVVQAVTPGRAAAVVAEKVSGNEGETSSAAGNAGGKSMEALVTEALKPMLREWLDANLPQLVEEQLQAELKRRVK